MSNDEETKLFMKDQIKEINKAKYLEGCHTNCDPGQTFIFQWILKNAATYNKNWWAARHI